MRKRLEKHRKHTHVFIFISLIVDTKSLLHQIASNSGKYRKKEENQSQPKQEQQETNMVSGKRCDSVAAHQNQ